MPRKPKEQIVQPIHSELCGNCFYNLQSICKRDPELCEYNKPQYIKEDEEKEEEE